MPDETPLKPVTIKLEDPDILKKLDVIATSEFRTSEAQATVFIYTALKSWPPKKAPPNQDSAGKSARSKTSETNGVVAVPD